MNLDFYAHPAQLKVIQHINRPGNEHTTLVAGRRFGKTALQLRIALLKAYCNYDTFDPAFRPDVLLFNPTMVQARRVLWRPLKNLLDYHGVEYKANGSEHTIDLGPRFPLIRVAGINDNNGDGCRGLKLLHVGADECQDIRMTSLEEVIWPAMADTPGSTALYTGTPKGKKNTLYHLAMMDEAMFFHFPSWANTTIPNFRRRCKNALRRLPRRAWLQEFWGSFEDAEGLFYSAFDPQVNIVQELPQQRYVSYVGYDPGQVNPGVVIILEGETDKSFYVVYWKQYGDGVNAVLPEDVRADVLRVIDKRGYKNMAIMVDPSCPAEILALRQKAALQGVNDFTYGINTVNTMFHKQRLFVVEPLADKAPDEILSYVRKQDKDGSYYEDKEGDGIPTHCLDGLRYVMATLNKKRKSVFTALRY